MSISGIYKIQSVSNPKKIYIGSAINIKHRWACHLSDLKKNKHASTKLQNHYNKYGKKDLEFSIISGCDKNDLVNMEQFYIDAYKPFFNICKIAGSQLGTKRSLESKLKMRFNLQGRYIGVNNPFYGKHHTEESKQKNREKHLGKLSPMKDKHHSEETLQKLKKPKSAEHKYKLSLAKKGKYTGEDSPRFGKHHSLETRLKMSNAKKGRKGTRPGYRHSEETHKKLREAWGFRKLRIA